MNVLSKTHLFEVQRLPGRIDAEQTAHLLGFQTHDIPVLIRHKLISPLGNPVQSAPKWFASIDIQNLANDPKWLSKATKAISLHWKSKNKRLVQA